MARVGFTVRNEFLEVYRVEEGRSVVSLIFERDPVRQFTSFDPKLGSLSEVLKSTSGGEMTEGLSVIVELCLFTTPLYNTTFFSVPRLVTPILQW